MVLNLPIFLSSRSSTATIHHGGILIPLHHQCPNRDSHHRRTRSSRLQCRASIAALITPETVFNIVTVSVMPFYACMIGAPHKPFTRKLMSSHATWYCSALLYAALLMFWNPLLHFLRVFKASLACHANSDTNILLPNMSAFSVAFNSAEATTLTWLHLVALDLFQARWVYLDGLQHGIPIAHSAVLCFMVGPLGLLSHLLTKNIVLHVLRRKKSSLSH